MPRFMLDTDISSYILRDRPAVVGNRLRRVRGADVCVSVITEAELLYGVRLAGSDNDLQRDVDDFLRRLDVLVWDSAAAAEYAEIRSGLEGHGTPIGNMDLMIAAHARSLGATLVTNNERHFRRVAGLRVENWAR
jgi:tRNA(fMet)-specific endonuclease VapC